MMYSKSQTTSPKPSNAFLTALPSSISAPSLLVLHKQQTTTPVNVQQPIAGGSHRKYNTLKHNNKEQNNQTSKSNNHKKNNITIQQPQQQQQQQQNSNNGNNNKKHKFHKKINFLNKNNIEQNNRYQNSNLINSNIVVSNDQQPDDYPSITRDLSNLSLAPQTQENEIQQKQQNQQENQAEIQYPPIEVIEQPQVQKPQELDDDSQEEIYPFSMKEETLGEYFSFLSILSDYIEHQIDQCGDSSIRTSSDCTSNITHPTFQVFNVDQEPEISIYNYILRIFKYLPFGTDIFIFSIIYLDRVIEQNPQIKLSYLNIHRLFMASVLVASKYHNDKSLNNRYYAQVGGVNLTEMNLLEIKFLILVDWNLLITTDTFNTYNDLIQLKIKSLNSNSIEHNNNSNQQTIEKPQLPSPSISPPLPPQQQTDKCISNNNYQQQSQQQQQQTDKCISNNNNIHQQNFKVEHTVQFVKTQPQHYQKPNINPSHQYNHRNNQNYYINQNLNNNFNNSNNNNNENNNFKNNIPKAPNNRVNPNYLTYPIPANQYHLYQYYQQPVVYHQQQTYDDQSVYYDYHQTSQQTQQQNIYSSQWLNGSYYYQQPF
ncbi:cyclin-related 2 family protein [Tieghemostelium lacteum]|uniref:Cyclin-related 2 family protein n=1 Tax=Tieghemostelium lacteum TaxID=361077 RepID=A0A151ZKG7_TIELA|nr:cyclin-related 2 family protein [Tieghemostelium lacteum]|eukprot:KYQ94417.1 cyclin-related 2 family protein [Tieghemostelium lacteum]